MTARKVVGYGGVLSIVLVAAYFLLQGAGPDDLIQTRSGIQGTDSTSDAEIPPEFQRVQTVVSETEVRSAAVELPLESIQRNPEQEAERPLRPVGNPALREYDRLLMSEPIDASWAPVVEATIDNTVRSIPIPFAEIEIACRTTICRATVFHQFVAPADGGAPPWDFNEYGRKLGLIIQQDPRLNGMLVSTFAENTSEENRGVAADESGELVTNIFLFGAPPAAGDELR